MPERRQLFLRGRGREGMGGDACRRLCLRRQAAGMCRSGTTFILFHQVLSYFLVSDHHSISEVGEKHVQIMSQSPNIISHMLYHNPSILVKGLNPYCFISGSNYQWYLGSAPGFNRRLFCVEFPSFLSQFRQIGDSKLADLPFAASAWW